MSLKKSKKSKKSSHKSKKSKTDKKKSHESRDAKDSERKKRSRSKSRSRSRSRSTRDDDKKKRLKRDESNGHRQRHGRDSRDKKQSRKDDRRSKSSHTDQKTSHHYSDRIKIDKSKLLEIAKANTLKSATAEQESQLSKPDQMDRTANLKLKTKSIDQLVEYCKKISELNDDAQTNDPAESDNSVHHPFQIKETTTLTVNNDLNVSDSFEVIQTKI
jgi:hypothetical protein